MDLLLNHLGQGLWCVILISMPVVLVAAGIGLIIGILQAVTQVQEQTISAAPKILAVFLLLIVGGTLILRVLNTYLTDAVTLAMEIIPKDGYFSMPSRNYNDPESSSKNFFVDDKFKIKKANPDFKELMNSSANIPYIKQDQAKEPDVYSPPPSLPGPKISEEIENYNNMKNKAKALKSLPSLEQKVPVIPPKNTKKIDKGANPIISLLPPLDEPPVVDPADLKSLPEIANSKIKNTSKITGAAANLTPEAKEQYHNKNIASTIIIGGESNANNCVYNNSKKSNSSKGAIILESN